jgi:uncharacterized coiled-coil DUF342 family protein
MCALVFWSLFGWLADYSFPFGQALELILACFKGTVSAQVNHLQQQLQKVNTIPRSSSKQQAQKLNNLESQAWLYEGILGRIGTDPSVNHEQIARTLEALEYKRSKILQELKRRRPRRYKVFAQIQNVSRTLLASQAEKDYEELQRIITNLVLFTRNRQPSQTVLSEIIDKLAREIEQNTSQISPYRLRLAYRVDELLRVLSAKLILNLSDSRTDSSYQAVVNELRSRLRLVSKEFNNLLNIRQEDRNELDRRLAENFNLSQNISELHREISNREEDIVALQQNRQNLLREIQDKQSQVTTLENSIFDLEREAQNATKLSQEQESYISNLQAQLSQLNQQRLELQRRIQDLAAYAQSKSSELEELQNEKGRLDAEKSRLEQDYQALYQHAQRQNNEIDNLKALLSQVRRAQSPVSNSQPHAQKTTKPIATKKTISVEDYNKIGNKSDYTLVKEYYRKDGTRVRSHYRRLNK